MRRQRFTILVVATHVGQFVDVSCSSIPGIVWPAAPGLYAARKLALLFQLDASQWWPLERIREYQFRQLAEVVAHAFATAPFYRQRLGEAGYDPQRGLSDELWARMPLLSRSDLQTAGSSLHSAAVPTEHGRVGQVLSSGSTGRPISARTTELTKGLWQVFTLRDHVWHRRDLAQTLAAIRDTTSPRARPPEGLLADNWGSATRDVAATGPAALLSIHSSVQEQADWLRHVNPGYLLSYPSMLTALSQHFRATGQTLPALREVRTFGEVLDSECRAACRDAWNVAVVDMYSSQEVGYIGLQCPEHEHYHVQSEGVLVEVLDDEGLACAAGEIGRVVVTTLHNFAMPLLRYELGDYAEVGEPCPCGRGLPVLKRILGRQRNMFVLPDGRRRWPAFDMHDSRGFAASLPVRQYQVVQRGAERLEVLLVASRRLSESEESGVRDMLVRGLGHPFQVTFEYVDEIPRLPSGKFEDFRFEAARS